MIRKRVSKKNKSNSIGSQRIYVLTATVIILGLIILARLYVLQVLAFSKYRALADGQHKVFSELTAKRGEIYLKDGDEDEYPLAVNKDYSMVYIEPKIIKNKDEVIDKLSEILKIDKEEIRTKFSNPNSMFKIIKHKISSQEVEQIKSLKLSGVKITTETLRYYPGSELASQIVGFVGSDGKETVGRYGIESYWEKELRGKNGSLSQERDSRGRWMSITDRNIVPAKDGVDLVLTIDATVQYEIEKILKKTIEKHSADEGTIIVQDPETGKILAMANYPNFNVNDFNKVEDMKVFSNSSVNSAYEPGSVFKAFTLATGIDTGVISASTTYVDNGFVKKSGYTIKNSDEKAHGKQTMTQVLEKSLNTGVIFAEKLIGNKRFGDYVKKFGFGEKTGIELPGDARGNTKNLKNPKRDIEFYTVAYGQGITTTPLQLVDAYSAIANGGLLMKPQIIDKIIYPNGKEKTIEPEKKCRVIKEDTAKEMRKMLQSVVVNGHGKRAAVPGYNVGGKTGTAQVAKKGSRGYEDGFTIGTFIGIAPVEKPLFTVLIKIVNPKDVQWAESSAAPAFGEVMKFLLNYYNVEPINT
ncbi:MAG TPA: penicillin-binding protein 2 [Candidatus Moranbacteria bacterium]|nr:penicillin-binding protein 2 [Candidatus Moranbacteria bacterium]